MRTPTPEQQAILVNTARVRLVRAAPGSGKTWLVAELIQRELSTWSAQGCGIAALSFTHVGGDEIRKAVGRELDHPHFVGTIDAFLHRYVIRPFLRYCFPWFANPRLIPGEWGAEHWSKYESNQIATVCNGTINLFGCLFIDEEQGQSVVAHKPHPAQPLRRIEGDELVEVKEGKKRLWKQTGCLTHSDAALWASKILEHPRHGASVRAEIVRRFPLLIVDELQDTGFFLGKSIRLLLSESTVRGVLVGDPDQAIFEFNGARPDLFDGFESIPGAVSLPLANSRRCPRSIVEAAKHLRDSGGEIGPAEDKEGRAFLVRYNDMKADVDRILRIITHMRPTSKTKVVARNNQTIWELVDRVSVAPPKLGCPALNHIQRAVTAFRQGRQIAALAAARAGIDIAVFKHEGVTDEKLNKSQIEPQTWKSLAVRCLLGANALVATGYVFDWQKAAGEILDAELSGLGLDPSLQFVSGKLTPQKRSGWDKSVAGFLPQLSVPGLRLTDIPVQTVHGVKGETHDVTIFVCPTVTRDVRCPSSVWWSTDSKDREEKRIAYVAMTRTQGDLIVCVSEDCFQRLASRRPQFVASFENMTVEECVAALSEGVNVNDISFE